MGVKAALDFMIKGQPVAASVALEMGLLDRIVDGDLRAAALDYARELVAAAAKARRPGDRAGSRWHRRRVVCGAARGSGEELARCLRRSVSSMRLNWVSAARPRKPQRAPAKSLCS